MNCPVCHSNHTKLLFQLDASHGVHGCSNCTVQFMWPQLNDEEIKTLYSEKYYASWGISGSSENEDSRQMKIATFLRQLEYIRQFVNSGKALDIGCATGYFLEAAQSQGFDPYGIELSEYSASIAKKKFGNHKIFNGKLEDCDFKPEQFASISMFDLLEHVRSPLQTLTKAAELLDKNGVILVTTPDNSSFSNKLMGKKWTHYKLEHFFYFNSKSLHLLTQQTGLKIAGEWKSKKALNLLYLHTQLNVYKHWLLTPAINFLCFILPAKLVRKNFYISIGEITVAFRK